MAQRFATTIQMVSGLVPHTTIDANSQPSSTQVQDMILQVDNDVSLALGNLLQIDAGSQAAFLATILDQAARVVALEVGSLVWEAKNPEGVAPADGVGWGSILHNRYKEALANLQSAAFRGTDAPDGEAIPSAGPLWTTPGTDSTSDLPLFVTRLEPFADSDIYGGSIDTGDNSLLLGFP